MTSEAAAQWFLNPFFLCPILVVTTYLVLGKTRWRNKREEAVRHKVDSIKLKEKISV